MSDAIAQLQCLPLRCGGLLLLPRPWVVPEPEQISVDTPILDASGVECRADEACAIDGRLFVRGEVTCAATAAVVLPYWHRVVHRA